ncbi:MAG: hypothetical protein AB7Q16_17990 [Vicinamibacterales bacterium]
MSDVETMSDLRLRLQALVCAQRERRLQLLGALAETEQEIAEGEQMLAQLGLAPPAATTAGPAPVPEEPPAARLPANPQYPSAPRHPLMDRVEDLIRARGPLSKADLVRALQLRDQRGLKFLDGWFARGALVRDAAGRYSLSTVVAFERRLA